jgi:hypothetical protein
LANKYVVTIPNGLASHNLHIDWPHPPWVGQSVYCHHI